MIQLVEDALEQKRVIRRACKSNWLKLLGIVLYHLGLSLRDDSSALESPGGASHGAKEAVPEVQTPVPYRIEEERGDSSERD